MTEGQLFYQLLSDLRAKTRRREKAGQPHYLCAFASSRERILIAIDASASSGEA